MVQFFNICQGQEVIFPGMRIKVHVSGETVWMHGKWLQLGPDHAVAVIDGRAEFIRPDGKILKVGDFPAWVVRGKGKYAAIAMMFNATQFSGGVIKIINRVGRATEYAVA